MTDQYVLNDLGVSDLDATLSYKDEEKSTDRLNNVFFICLNKK